MLFKNKGGGGGDVITDITKTRQGDNGKVLPQIVSYRQRNV